MAAMKILIIILEYHQRQWSRFRVPYLINLLTEPWPLYPGIIWPIHMNRYGLHNSQRNIHSTWTQEPFDPYTWSDRASDGAYTLLAIFMHADNTCLQRPLLSFLIPILLLGGSCFILPMVWHEPAIPDVPTLAVLCSTNWASVVL